MRKSVIAGIAIAACALVAVAIVFLFDRGSPAPRKGFDHPADPGTKAASPPATTAEPDPPPETAR